MQVTDFQVEFLNSLNFLGLHPKKLILKIGVAIIIVRNFNTPKLSKITSKIFEKERHRVENSDHNIVFIPRIPMITSGYPFKYHSKCYKIV